MVPARPRSTDRPGGVAGRREAGGGVVVVAQQPGEGGQAVVVHDLRPPQQPRLAVDVAEDLTAFLVEPQDARSTGEAHCLKMPQQRVHRPGPGLHGAAHRVADPHDLPVSVILQHMLVRHGTRLSTSPTSRSPFPNAPPPPSTRRPCAHPTGVGKGTTFELHVDPLHQAAQICSGSCGQIQQSHFQVVSAVLDLDTGALGRAGQISSRLLEGPLEPAESGSDRVRPELFGLNTSHRCPSSG